jgi:hypothetical protein
LVVSLLEEIFAFIKEHYRASQAHEISEHSCCVTLEAVQPVRKESGRR